MAYSYVTYTGNGVTAQFTVPFGYIRREHVQVFLNDEQTEAFSWANGSTVQLDDPPNSGVVVKLLRVTPVDESLVNFTDGSTPVARDFDTANTQNLYTNQEARDVSEEVVEKADLALATVQGAVNTSNEAIEVANEAAASAAAAALAAQQSEANINLAVETANDAEEKADLAIAALGGVVVFSYGTTPPALATPGDVWIDSEAGRKYTYIDDGNSGQWVQLE